MPRIEEIKDIPPDAVQSTVDDYKSEGALDVQTTKQPDGNFTIRATMPQ